MFQPVIAMTMVLIHPYVIQVVNVYVKQMLLAKSVHIASLVTLDSLIVEVFQTLEKNYDLVRKS